MSYLLYNKARLHLCTTSILAKKPLYRPAPFILERLYIMWYFLHNEVEKNHHLPIMWYLLSLNNSRLSHLLSIFSITI